MKGTNLVETVIRAASRRHSLVVAFEQLAVALAVVLCGGILLMVLGSEILRWYWLALLAVMGVGLAVFRVRERLLPRYRVAQMLDARLALHDSLSTAWFLQSSDKDASDPLVAFQLGQADELARGVDPASAFPLAGQRVWALTGALAAVVFGLFALRYLVTSSLSLQHSIIPIQLAGVFERSDNVAAKDKHNGPLSQSSDLKPATPQTGNQQQDGKTVSEQQTPAGKPDGSPMAGDSAKAQGPQEASKPTDPNARDKGQTDGKSGPSTGDEAKEQNQTGSQAKPTPDQQDASQQNSSGLLDKMKDALSSLAQKMQPNTAAQKAQDGQKAPSDQKSGDQNSASRDQNGQAQQDAQNRQAGQQSAQGQAQGQTAEKAQAAQGQTSSQSADKSNSDSHSGIGRQDGDKALKEAQQLQAMGKLAEIIGKRSANVSGDMMVERPSGKQHLQTEYTQRVGQHADSGGEINRDQIPVEYQQYVREYMEQVRKQDKNQ